MRHTEPECCRDCAHPCDQGHGCTRFKKCQRWRQWFRGEWARIRHAAAIIKEREE